MTKKPEKTDDIIGYVTLSSGDRITLVMPTMGDIFELLMGQVPPSDTPYYMIAKCMKCTIDQARALPMTDGLAIMNKINPAIEAFSNFTKG